MALAAQAKLLRVLQERPSSRVGGGDPVQVDVRVLAATNRDLRAAVCRRPFPRGPSTSACSVVDLEIPPLRDRGADVLLLARTFLAASSRPGLTFTPGAEKALLAYPWPGNVRELANAVERATIFCRGTDVQPDDFPGEVRAAAADGNSASAGLLLWDPADDFMTAKDKLIDRFERDFLIAALREHKGNLSQAAQRLGMHRQNLQQKLHKLGIAAEVFRNG